jgi:basic amino acid/polyamine antiporter, APA family
MARDGVFPRVFARESARHTPVFALVTTSGLVTLLVLANFHGSTVQVFRVLILLATFANLVPYLVCSLALLTLLWRGRLAGSRRGTPWLAAAGALGAAYSLWAIAGAGKDATVWGAVLLAAALPVYALMKRKRQGAVRDG